MAKNCAHSAKQSIRTHDPFEIFLAVEQLSKCDGPSISSSCLQTRTRATSNDRDTVGIRKIEDRFAVEQYRAISLDEDRFSSGFAHLFDGLHPDGRQVESHILMRLGYLDQRKATSRTYLGSSLNASIGPFDRLDRQDARSRTVTLWPTSRSPIRFAKSHPKSISSSMLRVGLARVKHPSSAINLERPQSLIRLACPPFHKTVRPSSTSNHRGYRHFAG